MGIGVRLCDMGHGISTVPFMKKGERDLVLEELGSLVMDEYVVVFAIHRSGSGLCREPF